MSYVTSMANMIVIQFSRGQFKSNQMNATSASFDVYFSIPTAVIDVYFTYCAFPKPTIIRTLDIDPIPKMM